MNFSQFRVGKEFFTRTGRWRCTDKGKRTIIAIKINYDDKSWFNGPPYAVAESVFDEYDIEGCVPTYQTAKKEWGKYFMAAEKQREDGQRVRGKKIKNSFLKKKTNF